MVLMNLLLARPTAGGLLRATTLRYQGCRTMATASASSLGNREPSVDEISKMRSCQVVYDRYQRVVHEKQDHLTPLRAGWWAQKRAQMSSSATTWRSLAQMRKADSTFTPQDFAEEAEGIFQEFHNTLALAYTENLYDVATETLSDQIRTNPIPYASLVGTPQLTQIMSFIQPPDMCQARLLTFNSIATDMCFVQITLRFVSEARIMSMEDFGQLDRKRSRLVASKTSHKSRVSEPKGKFAIAFDNTRGRYYWHTTARSSSWKRPVTYYLDPVEFEADKGTLGVEGKTLKVLPDNIVHQEHIVVFERPAFRLSTPWRVASF
mmetsp:Transcript_13905/g.25737  ORF Transcript_13905/g.25737 Transcript_13905/m.25737 type:complete len:321 (+) Transcript_13905:195-1157(+)